jgi:hypothetical protein
MIAWGHAPNPYQVYYYAHRGVGEGIGGGGTSKYFNNCVITMILNTKNRGHPGFSNNPMYPLKRI